MTATATPYALLPDATQRWLIEIHARARSAIQDALDRHGRAPGLGHAIAQARVALLDAELQPVVEAVAAAGTPVDCKRGCSSCCTLKVEITPDEVFALQAELEATLDEASLAETKARALEVDAKGRGLPAGERYLMRLFCPVLDQASGACRGHASRPAACQGYLALDHRRCEASSRGVAAEILSPTSSGLIRDAVMAAQIIVLRDAGLDQSRGELSASLAAAWGDRDAERRWLAGGRAFPSIPAAGAS